MKPKTIVLLICGILLLIILLQNTQVVSIQLIFWKISMSRIIFLPLVALIGFGIGYFIGRTTRKRY
jgi:uncharacterized integral membrane protein